MNFKTFLTLFLISAIGAFILVTRLCLDNEPQVVWRSELLPADVDRIQRQLNKHNPQDLEVGDVRDLVATQRDINLLLHYGLSRKEQTKRMKAQVEIEPDGQGLVVRTSYALPNNPFGTYANFTTRLVQGEGRLDIDWMRLGLMPVPELFMGIFVGMVHSRLNGRLEEYDTLVEGAQALKDVRLEPDGLRLVYEWDPELAARLQAKSGGLAVTPEERRRLKAYHDFLPKATPLGRSDVSVADFIQPFFEYAAQRTEEGNDPVAENRALLLTLALYIHGKSFDDFTGSGKALGQTHPKILRLSLAGRFDLAQHFLISAGLTVAAGSEVADAIGVFKEMDDSRGGSGFSFPDLTADRAGVRLASAATASIAQARLVQLAMRNIRAEKAFMPSIDKLPEGLQAVEFQSRFGDTESETYRKVRAEIERRLEDCQVYKELAANSG